MGRYTVIVISVIIAVAVELVSCSSCEEEGGGESEISIPRSNSGRPFGRDITDNVEVYPYYDQPRDVVGLGVEVRPNSDLNVRLTGGVGGLDLLRGQIGRPQGDLEIEHRLSENVRWNVGAGVDGNGDPRAHAGIVVRPNKNVRWNVGAGVDSDGEPQVHAGLNIDLRRRRSTGSAFLDEEKSRMLFKVFDLNQDGEIDVVDWSTEGGKVVSFSDLIVAHDIDGDEKLSLEEFLAIPILPDLGLGRALGWDDDVQGDEDIPTASPAQD